MKFFTFIVITLGLFLSSSLEAAQCSAVFPTGIQSHTTNGRLTVNSNVDVLNVSSSSLPFKNQTINSNTNDSCGSADCSASGSPADAITLPIYPSISGGQSINVGSVTLGGGSYNTNTFGFVTIEKNGVADFSSNYSEYFIEGLTIEGKATLNMKPGVYWVEQLILEGNNANLNVVSSGTVYLYVKNDVVTNAGSEINGINGNAVLSLNVYGNLTLNSNSDVSGLGYVDGITTINSNSTFTGTISTGDMVLNSNSTFDYQPDLISDYDFDSVCSDSAPELIAHFEFNQGSGQTAFDSSGYGRNATLGNSASVTTQDPTWQCEASGHFLDFSRTSNQRMITSAFSPPETGVVAFWMKIPSVPNALNRIFGFGDGFEIRFNAGGVMYVDINKLDTNSSIRTSGAFTTTDTWTHFAFSTDVSTGNWAVYINGQLDNSGNEALTVQSSSQLTIGGSTWQAGGQSFNGSLDDFRIYSGLLTKAEIEALYANPPQPCEQIHHYDIVHTNDAFTCEATNITINACQDEACTLSTEAVSLDFIVDNNIENAQAFTGSTSFSYANTTEQTVTLGIANESIAPSNPLRCNNSAASGACDLEFVDAGFQFFGASIGDALPDQEAETNWQNVNLRAVEKNTTTGACQAALVGDTDITFGFDCQDPATCLTDFASIIITGDGSGEFTQTQPLTFDAGGIASLATLNLNYADAGQLKLIAETSSPKVLRGESLVDVYPSYLKIDVTNTALEYTGNTDSDTYTAGEAFTYRIGAYGAQDSPLPNYQEKDLGIKVERTYPTVSGTVDGEFQYRDGAQLTSGTSSPAFSSVNGVTFTNGIYSYSGAYYTETGRILLDVQDANYLGNQINSEDSLALGTFIPAYFAVSFASDVKLNNVHINDGSDNDSADNFSYVGQELTFAVEPSFTLVPKNALASLTDSDTTTFNYLLSDWNYAPTLSDLQDTDNVSVVDTSDYSATGTITLSHENGPDITDVPSEGGKTLTFDGTELTYNKVDGQNKMFGPIDAFSALFDLNLGSALFTDNKGVCFKGDHLDPDCNTYVFSAVSGANLRFGRFVLDSTYGPETETIQVPFYVEFFDDGRWQINTLDNHTNIDFDESSGHLVLSQVGATDLTGNINNISSDGALLLGQADKIIDLLISYPGSTGEVLLKLNPLLAPTNWPNYLNHDWDGDDVICNLASCPDTDDHDSDPQLTDYPSATISFGLFRGNDRIIQWREVF